MSSFLITIRAENLDDAFDIYGSVLNTRCARRADAMLAFEIGNETKILSRDEVKKRGAGHAGFQRDVHAV